MKKLLLIFMFIVNVFAVNIAYNLDQAKIEAQRTNKPILLIIYSPTCPHCKDYLISLRNNKNMMRYIANNFVVLLIALNNGVVIPQNIPFNGFVPFTDILNSNGDVLSPPLKGKIPLDTLYQYLSQSKMLFYKAQQYQ